jgi:calcineurin-like phosphoesterase family protein
VIDFDKRPFTDMDHMHRVLINNYNACVSNDNTCYFLGDFSMGNVEETRSIVEQLNGTKILILGNHDKNASSMKRAGFDVVLYMASIVIAGETVTMTHCPLRGVFREDTSQMKNSHLGENWHGETKHKHFSIPDWGQYHLHGHCHKGPEERTLDRQWDVGIKANNYRPVSSSQIESWITLRKKYGNIGDRQ